MARIISHFKSPLLWFSVLLTLVTINNNFSNDGKFNHVVRSDGSGYYAYLPATLIYKDPSYKKVVRAEQQYIGKHHAPLYLYKNDKGRTFNKYFPGVAFLQLPFFGIACLTALISGEYIDGYGAIFQFCFLLGSLFYTIMGLYLFRQFLRHIFTNHPILDWLIIFFYLSTTLFFYSSVAPNLSHHYTFFLFGLFSWTIIQLKKNFARKIIFGLGVILGLIALVRPTNLIVVLSLPFFFASWNELKSFLLKITTPTILLSGFLGFISMFSSLLFLWKWQSGDWIVWGYMGEGFNFLHPKFIESLFSFRIGLFLHTPIFILATLGTYFLYKNNKIQFSFWWLYFLLNVWIISAWWCWDYESPFGHRPFTEHFFFLIIPFIHFANKFQRLIIALSICCVGLGLLRYEQMTTGKFGNQRFTPKSYFSSLQFWKRSNDDRFQFTLHSRPYGKRIEHDVLYYRRKIEEVNPFGQYYCSAEKELHFPRTTERFFYSVEMEKKLSVDGLSEVYLVIHAENKDKTKAFYKAVEIFNDRYEAIDKWKKITIQGLIYDNFQEFESIKLYIWNPTGKWVELRNIKYTIDTYKS